MHVPPLRFLKLSRYELDFKDSILFSSIYGSGARFVDVHQGVRLLEFERASKIKSLKTAVPIIEVQLKHFKEKCYERPDTT